MLVSNAIDLYQIILCELSVNVPTLNEVFVVSTKLNPELYLDASPC